MDTFPSALMKLRSDAVTENLAYRFNVSNARSLLKWMKQLDYLDIVV